jgi:hypothetical protein
MPATSSAAPSLVTLTAENTTLCMVSGLASMPIDDRERFFRRYGSANALRQWRLDDRDAAIRQLAAHYTLPSGRQLAAAIRADLIRYAASGYQHKRLSVAVSDKRSLLHRVLDLVGAGKLPGITQMRTILAGMRS